MADTKAKPVKAERKKPVRKAPKQSDYPTRLAWLAAMVEYEKAEAEKATAAKVERLDKRIQSAVHQVEQARARLDKLTAERAALMGVGHEDEGETIVVDLPEAEDETTAG